MTATVLFNGSETPTTRRVRLAVDGRFPYRAGQAAALSAGGPATPYSIASAPAETGRFGWLEFLVKVDGSSRFGAIVDSLRTGTTVEVSDAAGEFTLDRVPAGNPILFVAGGTGIAPVRSIIRQALDADRDGRLSLLYSNRSPEEFAYLSELKTLADDGRLHLTLTLTGDAQDWTHARGRAGTSHLSELVQPQTQAFLCGPQSMVSDVSAVLIALGLDRNSIRTEQW